MHDSKPAEEAALLAEQMLSESLKRTSMGETIRMQRLARMIGAPEAKQLSLAMTDQLGRSDDSQRVAELWRKLLLKFGTDSGFSRFDQVLLNLGGLWSQIIPGTVMWAVRKRLETESRDVILREEEPFLGSHLSDKEAGSTGVNLNQLGEAVMGEKEATRRLSSAIDLLQRDDVDYVSVKVSAIYSQIKLVAWDSSLKTVKKRLRQLYQTAADGGDKFVNLDMEAYYDLDLTIAAFKEVLAEPAFQNLPAGIALQAYLPDSINKQIELTEWARQRCKDGGAPIKIRLVKGANLAMECVEAELHGWSPTPHRSKADSDACFKRMLEYACQPENAEAVKVGVGSHNLFDVALALVLREKYKVTERVEIEMIQGMAPAQARTVQEQANGLLLYTPIVTREQFGSALAYLIRRLDENTADGNFLASLFSLRPGSKSWQTEKAKFLQAWQQRHQVSDVSRRKTLPPHDTDRFLNEPDTDWTRKLHRESLYNAVAPKDKPAEADAAGIESILQAAYQGRSEWARTTIAERAGILRACAYHLAQTRFGTIALLQDEGKKAPTEADTEISEAIDFARYYALTGKLPEFTETNPLGTVLIAPPWNFPFAIPCGGVLAALMAGNTVILKPAPEVTQIGWWLARVLWKAGVPKHALHFVACSDGEIGKQLIVDERTSAVVLTGAYETARKFQQWRPALPLFAETSGKNALVVSALADRELAAKDLVKSAFGHSGQKCSATSLAILEAEVYEDQGFLELLKDAAASLTVGPSSDPASVITPLVQPPGESLHRALTELEPGESWLLEPKVSEQEPCLWSPGIKLAVQPGSWFHRTECFGPVLGIIKASDLNHAVEIQNDVSYGLTAGFHSLDEEEIASWKQKVEAGNLYINRGTTGAIVQRQPFGGWKASSIGPGFKAGGPNYVNLFRTITDDVDKISFEQFTQAWRSHYTKTHDPSGLKCERNELRYLPQSGILFRLAKADDALVTKLKFIAQLTGVAIHISSADDESERYLMDNLPAVEQIRTFGDTEYQPEEKLLDACHQLGINWTNYPFCNQPEVELPRWLKEQSISETRHRYGNLMD